MYQAVCPSSSSASGTDVLRDVGSCSFPAESPALLPEPVVSIQSVSLEMQNLALRLSHQRLFTGMI